jgi:hypothetical protein
VTKAHEAFCKLAKQLSPKIVILNGDILDGARISRHARIMWEKQPDLKDEIAAVQDRCAEIERAASGAKFVRTIGNHDARFGNYLSSRVGEFEEMTGMTLHRTAHTRSRPASSRIRCSAAGRNRDNGGAGNRETRCIQGRGKLDSARPKENSYHVQ